MSEKWSLEKIFERLPDCDDSPQKHFTLCYGLRNPRRGPGLSYWGVESRDLIDHYAKALDHMYAVLAGQNWTPPHKNSKGRIPVAVFYTADYNGHDASFITARGGVSVIGLRNDNGEPTYQALLDRAAVEAAHEAAHTFTHRHRPLQGMYTQPWEWFDEATAVFMERLAFPDKRETLRYSGHWCRRPDLSLAHPDWPRGYFAGMFIEYLVKAFDLQLLHDIWHKARREDRPIDILQRLLEDRGVPIADVAAQVRDLFGARYFLDTYFDNGYAQDVFDRYGRRSVRHSLTVRKGSNKPVAEDDGLDHLCCRYYHLFAAANVQAVEVAVYTGAPPDHCRIKAALVAVEGSARQGEPVFLKRQADAGGGGTQLAGQIAFPQGEQAYVLLVVSNVNIPSVGFLTHADNAQCYRLEITGH